MRHAFFGTERVVDALRAAPGFAGGLVRLEPGCAVRDAKTNLVVGLRVGGNEGGNEGGEAPAAAAAAPVACGQEAAAAAQEATAEAAAVCVW